MPERQKRKFFVQTAFYVEVRYIWRLSGFIANGFSFDMKIYFQIFLRKRFCCLLSQTETMRTEFSKIF